MEETVLQHILPQDEDEVDDLHVIICMHQILLEVKVWILHLLVMVLHQFIL